MQQDFDYPVEKPEKHRQSILWQAPLGFAIGRKI
jgi:hypothetical protein